VGSDLLSGDFFGPRAARTPHLSEIRLAAQVGRVTTRMGSILDRLKNPLCEKRMKNWPLCFPVAQFLAYTTIKKNQGKSSDELILKRFRRLSVHTIQPKKHGFHSIEKHVIGI